ncbi:MAG: Gfo/Idh/MocA family oxidoreductase, partial [Desulfobacterales bacterium]|nr:Gfo/Idh/MocA family oxidoreductase [Desulfobacterales bacterium]
MNKLRFAIVGTGNVSNDHISALNNTAGVELTHIFGRNEIILNELAEKHHILPVTDYFELLKNPDIDVIDITLPSGLHADFGIEAAKAGKHVVVEKPIDVSLEKAQALIDECKKQGVILSVISQMRFSDAMQQLHQYVADGRFGKLLQGDAYIKWYRTQDYYESGAWRGTHALDGGGAFINQGIHYIDLLLSVMGPLKSVYGKVRTANHEIEVEDNGIALLEFSAGAQGVIQASTALFPGQSARLEIHGTKGSVVFENDEIVFQHFEGEEAFSATPSAQAGMASDPRATNSALFIR